MPVAISLVIPWTRLTFGDCRAELVVLMEPYPSAEDEEESELLSDAKNGFYEDNRELR